MATCNKMQSGGWAAFAFDTVLNKSDKRIISRQTVTDGT